MTLNQRLDQMGPHYRSIYGRLYRVLAILEAATSSEPPFMKPSNIEFLIGSLVECTADLKKAAMEIRDADPSTFEKLEGVGQGAYWKRQRETPFSEIMKRAGAEPEISRLQALTTEVINRVNVKPILCINPDDGDVYVHPELARELEKPINEELRFEVGSMGRTAAARKREQS